MSMCPLCYHHNGFVATHALGHMMYDWNAWRPGGYIVLCFIYIYIYTQKLKSPKLGVLEWILNKKTHFQLSQIFRLFYITFYSVFFFVFVFFPFFLPPFSFFLFFFFCFFLFLHFTKSLHTQQKLKIN